eukprot:TRINITY_DN9005_c0_g1_i7.p1 TRINITY_DN9005_c0_g1~~TRINITY_DN9005_c0_g1_i7.p1  ORF type:complete len:234 (+),score=26.43 TRINITY_DN9005_c0_g1_i7:419-1120(+)
MKFLQFITRQLFIFIQFAKKQEICHQQQDAQKNFCIQIRAFSTLIKRLRITSKKIQIMGFLDKSKKNLATVDNNKKAFENLRLALLFKDDETLKTINMYSKRVEKKKDKILSDFTNRFVKLGKYINENEDLQSALSDFTKNVTKKVYQDIIKTSDLISLRKAVFQKPNPGQYTLSCDDFQTPDIKNIMKKKKKKKKKKSSSLIPCLLKKFQAPAQIPVLNKKETRKIKKKKKQ